MTSAQSVPPSGWYPDPGGSGHERYWDGGGWTLYMRVPPAPELPCAAWGWRALAAMVDLVVLFVIAQLLQALAPWPWLKVMTDGMDAMYSALERGELYTAFMYPGFTTAWLTNMSVALIIAVTYHAVFLSRWGATVGKMAFGLRVVPAGEPTAQRLSVKTAVVRSLAYEVFGNIPFFNFVNWFSPLWRARRQGFHDSLAATVVLKISQER